MTYEVVVVGGGIGGLTVAALLAARGVSVCLLERASRPGGCLAGFEKFGYTFDSSAGIYTGWEPGEIHDRIFSELSVEPPEVCPLDPALIVRLPDQTEIPITSSTEQFEASLLAAFPECADRAIEFYRESAPISDALRRAAGRVPDLATADNLKRTYALLPDFFAAARIFKHRNRTTPAALAGTSLRFRRFVDVQLQLLTQNTSVDCSYLCATVALNALRGGAFSIRGGAPALAEKLAASIKASGGRIRFDTPVLRLAYDNAGQAVGVDLLSGETVSASRAIISNLTVWDTYGKLIGLNRTPPDVRKQLTDSSSWGAYLLYVGMDETAAARIPNDRILALTDWQKQNYDPESSQFMFASPPADDPRAPEGKRAAMILAFSDVKEWFTYHQDEEQHERQDQAMIEAWWPRIHKAIPEFGDGLELIETATPRTYYDLTRRKLGMVGALRGAFRSFGRSTLGPLTTLPNVFMVGDTVLPGGGIAGVSYAALSLARIIVA